MLWHYSRTGRGFTVSMPIKNNFSPDTVGGSFYNTPGGWVCSGNLSFTPMGGAIFNVWLDDTYTKDVAEGPSTNALFKLLVYENNQWYEVQPGQIKYAGGSVVNWKPAVFKVVDLNYMTVPTTSVINKVLTDIVPVVNPALLLSVPDMWLKNSSFSVNSNVKSTVKIEYVQSFCTVKEVVFDGLPDYIKFNKYTNEWAYFSKFNGSLLTGAISFKMNITATPWNADLPEFTKEFEITINGDNAFVDGIVNFSKTQNDLIISSDTMITRNVVVYAYVPANAELPNGSRKRLELGWFNLNDRQPVNIKIQLTKIPSNFVVIEAYFTENNKRYTLTADNFKSLT